VRTVIFSDLHLGASTGADVARDPDVRGRLLQAAAEADRVVMLGDLLELRELPVGEILVQTRPFFDELAQAIAGKRLLLVPGNHDYQLAEPFLTRYRLDPGGLPTEAEWPVAPGDGVAGRLAEWLPDVELTLGYPGVRLRPDIWATHGHYLDVHLTIPRLETIFAGAVGRLTKRGRDCRSTADYEAVLSPIYGFNNALAQGVSPRAVTRGASLSRTVWSRANGTGEGGALGRLLVGKIAIPGGVAALNLTGLGPFGYDISGAELRRTGLRSMARVVEGLGIEADHVIFGHSHRRGPEPGDAPEEWRLPGGTQLWNTGTWFYERVLMGQDRRDSPYWPGSVIRLDDDGPPELDNVLGDLPLPVGLGTEH
jgi:predicted phosphodiesterase